MKHYPIAVKLASKSVLVIGGGPVAERKVLSLLETGARVRVISLTLTPQLLRLKGLKRISWLKGRVRKKDLAGAKFIIAATDDRKANKDVSSWAKSKSIPVNVVDQPSLSSFISPAILRRGKAILAVYTDGKDPVLSRDLKNFLKEQWDEFISYRDRLEKG